MDPLPEFATPVAFTSPQLNITTNELSDDEIIEVKGYHCTKTYSSDEYGCVSDHPSEDLSDLALVFRDESFAPAPLLVCRTYSSSNESFTSRELTDDEILEVTECHATNTYSSDEYACVSDHPSEDPFDLSLAVRDESFAPVPPIVTRTYSSSDESLWIDNIYVQENSDFHKCSVGPEEEMEDDGYVSIEDSTDTSDETETARTFEVTDPVPTSRAQMLFVMAWNGESSSCGEDVGDIETLPSDEEARDVEDEDGQSAGERGSIHTLESSTEREIEKRFDGLTEKPNLIPSSVSSIDVSEKVLQKVGGSYDGAKELPALPADEITVRNEIPSSIIKRSPQSETARIDKPESHKADEKHPYMTESEDGTRFERISSCDIKASSSKKRNPFKRITKMFALCFGKTTS